MSFAKKFNTARSKFTFEPNENMSFVKPSELVEINGIDNVYTLKGCYLNRNGAYGNEPILITETHFVNAPLHLAETIHSVLKDDNAVKLVNLNKVGFKFYEYENKYGPLNISSNSIDDKTPFVWENEMWPWEGSD